MGTSRWVVSAIVALALTAATSAAADDDQNFQRLFTQDGVPEGWLVCPWDDLAKPAAAETQWNVEDGILRPGRQRGTWLISEREYADFILEFEIKLTEHGNSGVALRTQLQGDPAFDALELQFADLRYNPRAKDNELTGGIYRAIAPTQQVYLPAQWNHCRIELQQSHLRVWLNGHQIQDVDLAQFHQSVERHDRSSAPPIKDRPGKGRIGFQHLSRNNEPIEIRNVRIREL